MGRNNSHWFNYTPKAPQGFSNVKGKIGYYTHITELVIIEENNNIFYDKIIVRFRINQNKDIDFEYTSKTISNDYNLKHIIFDDFHFKRDGGLFPYIKTIKSYDSIDNYKSYKKLKDRNKKLKKLLKKPIL
ncbi:MAG: hypothetical protein ACOC2W_04745 [bacterium]